MMEQQRLKRCFQIKEGFLFIKLTNFLLEFEYMRSQKQKQLYRVRLKKQLDNNLLNYFSSTTHLYKYLTECPYKIINITEKRMQIVVTRAYQHSLVTLQLQKVENVSNQYLFRLKMIILKQQIQMRKINNLQNQDRNKQINSELEDLLVQAKQKYHFHTIKLDNYQSILREKQEELKQLQEEIKLKTAKLQESKKRKIQYYTIDD